MHRVSVRSLLGTSVKTVIGIRHFRERRPNGPFIINYHGIVDSIRDPVLDEYNIDTDGFSKHVAFLSKQYTIVPLSVMIDRVKTGNNIPPDWAAITMDDAFVSQTTTARKILSGHQIPWSISLPAGVIGTGRGIWSNELAFLVMACWDRDVLPLPGNPDRKVPCVTHPERRNALLEARRILFGNVSASDRVSYINGLIGLMGENSFFKRFNQDGRFVIASWDEIRLLADAGVELLSHGLQHVPLNHTASLEEIREEIAVSRWLIYEKSGHMPKGFVLPHGAADPTIYDVLEKAGYEFCLSTVSSKVSHQDFPFRIPRIDGAFPLAILRNHLTSI